MKRLLIFGARGFLGGWVESAAGQWFDTAVSADRWGRVDITDRAACEKIFDRVSPDCVCLLAAVSDIDRCERDPELSERVNVRGAENVARECRRTDARLVFTSSGAVYDGNAMSYVETDPPSPVSVYGRAKARAETLLTGLVSNLVIARLSLVLGFAPSNGTNALLNKLVTSWEAGKAVGVSAGEHRNAIDAATAAAFLLELASSERLTGIYHIGSSNVLSRLEIARKLAHELGFSADLATPQGAPPQGRAPRGKHEFLRTEKLAAACITPVPTCEESIMRCAHATAQSRT